MFSGHPVRSALIGSFTALVFLLTSVGGDSKHAAITGGAALAAPIPGPCDSLRDFDRGNFPNPLVINNPLFSLTPGMQYTYDGMAGGLPRRVIFTVTDVTKRIDGVLSRVIWDVDLAAGVKAEEELAFFAQDNRPGGNVWAMGEYPEEFVGGVFDGAPRTWIPRQLGARAGVHFPGRPRVGMDPYHQGKAVPVFWDCAVPVATGGTVSLPGFPSFTGVLTTNEWSALDPAGGIQAKQYAPSIRQVIKIFELADPSGEFLNLTRIRSLGADPREEANDQALRLDRRGYTNGGPGYAATPRATCQQFCP